MLSQYTIERNCAKLQFSPSFRNAVNKFQISCLLRFLDSERNDEYIDFTMVHSKVFLCLSYFGLVQKSSTFRVVSGRKYNLTGIWRIGEREVKHK